MNDEAFQAEYRTRITRSMSDEDMAREMYDAGRRAERERIIQRLSQIDEAMDGPDAFIYRVCEFIDELRADPAESGE